MIGPAPSVAKIRLALRHQLQELTAAGVLHAGDTVFVATSGGADSLALASQLAFVAPRMGLHAAAVTVDHGFQPDSAHTAHLVAGRLLALGIDPVYSIRAVAEPGESGAWETAARARRYRAFEELAQHTNAPVIMLGHTADDQAETVLIQLARGSGARSLAGMSPWNPPFARPMLQIERATTEAACAELGLEVYEDPTNSLDGPWLQADGRPLPRAAVRHHLLPELIKYLGPGVKAGLVRSAQLLDDDAAYLDGVAHQELADLVQAGAVAGAESGAPVGEVSCAVASLETLAPAIMRRVLRLLALQAGATFPTFTQLAAAAKLITAWRGQGPIQLSGGVWVERKCGRLRMFPTTGHNQVEPAT